MRSHGKRMLAGILNRVFLLLELRLLPGLAQRLVLVAGLILSMTVGGGLLVWWLDPQGNTVWQDIWWAFLHLTDPGYLGDDQGITRRVVATCLTISGLVVFVGLLVAVMTQWMTQRITAFERGVTRVPFRDHVIILGWGNRTVALVRELVSSGPRVRLFLRARGERGIRVVILDPDVDHEMHLALKDGLGDLYDPRRVLLRYGSPLRSEHLDRAALSRAAAVILPAVDIEDATQVSSDAQVIKTLMAAAAALEGSGDPPPPIVVELHDPTKADLATEAYPGAIDAVAAERFLAQIIAQNVRYTGLSYIYRDILTHATGNELYAPDLPELSGTTFDEARRRLPEGILLGWVTTGDRCRATLCPPADATVPPGARLLVLARSLASTDPVARARPPAAIAGNGGEDLRPDSKGRILVLGWSRKLPALLAELDDFSTGRQSVDVVSVQPADVRDRTLARSNITLRNLDVRMLEAEFTNRIELEALQPWTYDDIVVVASDWIDEVDEADARAVLAYLMLRKVLEPHDDQPDIIVELLDEHSEPMLGSDRHEVIVGPDLISHMLTHVALRRELAPVFSDIFTPGGAEVVVVPLSRWGITPGTYGFDTLADTAAARREVFLGVRHAGRPGPVLNPSRHDDQKLESGDRLVLLVNVEAEPG